MEQLLSTPVRPAEMVLGKMLGLLRAGHRRHAVSHCRRRAHLQRAAARQPAAAGRTSCIFLFGALCWGIFLSAVARTQLLAYQMGMLTSFLPAFLLSGFVYSIENMPPVIQVVTYIVPARYFVTILKGIFLKGVGVRSPVGGGRCFCSRMRPSCSWSQRRNCARRWLDHVGSEFAKSSARSSARRCASRACASCCSGRRSSSSSSSATP